MIRETALRSCLWLLLGSWIGAWLLFAFGVSITAFQVLAPDQAGRVVGPLLSGLHLYGAGAGVGLALLAWALRRGPLTIALPLAAGALCAVSQLAVTPEIASLRQLALGPEGDLASAARFAHLHQLSMLLFSAVGAAAIALVPLHVRADLRTGCSESPTR